MFESSIGTEWETIILLCCTNILYKFFGVESKSRSAIFIFEFFISIHRYDNCIDIMFFIKQFFNIFRKLRFSSSRCPSNSYKRNLRAFFWMFELLYSFTNLIRYFFLYEKRVIFNAFFKPILNPDPIYIPNFRIIALLESDHFIELSLTFLFRILSVTFGELFHQFFSYRKA